VTGAGDSSQSEPRSRGGHGGPTPHDALAAYALGALDVDEQRLFELHVFVCRSCRAELDGLRRTVGLLPYGLPPARPPAVSREHLLERARADLMDRSEAPTVSMPPVTDDDVPTVTVPSVSAIAPSVTAPPIVPDDAATISAPAAASRAPAPTVVQARTGPMQAGEGTKVAMATAPRQSGVRIKLASLGWAGALLFTLAAGVFAWVWGATAPHASMTTELLARLPGGHVLGLRGTGAPAASGRLFVLDGGRHVELTVDNLPPLNASRVYQLWVSETEQPARTAGAFRVDPRGDAAIEVTFPVPLERVRAITITQEPTPGSPLPTGPRLLDWNR
jgi:hypothetical protein